MWTHMQFTLFVRLFVTLFVLVTDKSKCTSSSGFTFTGRLEVGFFSVLFPARKTWRPWLHEPCNHSTTCPFNKSNICVHGASSPFWEANSFWARQEIPCFYGPRSFIIEFTKPYHLFLLWARWFQFIPVIFLFRSVLILPFRLRLCFPSCHFPLGFST
jgi:hypothetical protein